MLILQIKNLNSRGFEMSEEHTAPVAEEAESTQTDSQENTEGNVRGHVTTLTKSFINTNVAS